MPLQIFKEKRPFGWSPPPIALTIAVEIDRKGGDEIEFSSQVRQRLKGVDGPEPSLDVEKVSELREERKYVDIDPQRGMTQRLGDEKEESSAAAEIENRLGRTAMQFQVLGALNVET